MHQQLSHPAVATLLDELGAMTSIRDTHVLEQNLLRLLAPLLEADELWLYRENAAHEIYRVLHYSPPLAGGKVAKDTANNEAKNGTGKLGQLGHMGEVLHDHVTPPAVLKLIDNVRLLGGLQRSPASDQTDANGPMLLAKALHDGDQLRGYLVFHQTRALTVAQDTLLHGILEIFSNYYALLDTSQRDRLTGLHNRYSLEINLDRLWSVLAARLIEEEQVDNRRVTDLHNYWIGVLDIDHFKRINDTWGHIIGDEVLLLVARLLLQSFRHSDLIYRYGGEEFVTIIAANDLAGATCVFERARRTIEAHVFPQVGHITISGGFSGADPTVLPQMVINRADRSLYQAKSDGRNRIYHYDTLIEQGVLKALSDGSVDLF